LIGIKLYEGKFNIANFAQTWVNYLFRIEIAGMERFTTAAVVNCGKQYHLIQLPAVSSETVYTYNNR